MNIITASHVKQFTSKYFNCYKPYMSTKSIVHFEISKPEQTVTQYCYLDALTRLHEGVHVIHVILVELSHSTQLDHPSYSPDLALCHFRLFPKKASAADFLVFLIFKMLRSILEDKFQKWWQHRLTRFVNMFLLVHSGSFIVWPRASGQQNEILYDTCVNSIPFRQNCKTI